jgi:hypothetical protein
VAQSVEGRWSPDGPLHPCVEPVVKPVGEAERLVVIRHDYANPAYDSVKTWAFGGPNLFVVQVSVVNHATNLVQGWVGQMIGASAAARLRAEAMWVRKAAVTRAASRRKLHDSSVTTVTGSATGRNRIVAEPPELAYYPSCPLLPGDPAAQSPRG